MFTGIVLEQGIVKRARGKGVVEFEIEARDIASELRRGDSVAVNGVCLTATGLTRRRFRTEAMPETLALSTLGHLKKGSRVNLELAMRPSDRMGGHIVQGHVDGIAELVRAEDETSARRLWFRAGEDLLRFMVAKGSVTLDGVSLTITDVGRTTFQVAIIPHTLEATTLGGLQPGRYVNVEVDILAKYVERLLEGRK